MRNIIKIFSIIIAISLCLTGCSYLKQDKVPAVIEMTTKSGNASIAHSFNGLNMTRSGASLALAGVSTCYLQDEDDVLYFRFYCPACKYEEIEEFVAPYSKVFECDCPLKGDENFNSKEYFALKVLLKPQPEETG